MADVPAGNRKESSSPPLYSLGPSSSSSSMIASNSCFFFLSHLLFYPAFCLFSWKPQGILSQTEAERWTMKSRRPGAATPTERLPWFSCSLHRGLATGLCWLLVLILGCPELCRISLPPTPLSLPQFKHPIALS